MKNILITIIIFLITTHVVNSNEKNCSTLKKLSKEFLSCKNYELNKKMRGINPETGKINTQAEFDALKPEEKKSVVVKKVKKSKSKEITGKVKSDFNKVKSGVKKIFRNPFKKKD